MVAPESPTKQFLELPDTEFIFVTENFLPIAPQLRWCYEERILLDPLRELTPQPISSPASWKAWDTIEQLLPEKSTLLRTPAKQFFPRGLYRPLKAALLQYGARELGCLGLSPIHLSYYTSSSTQSWHCAAPHGPFAFCLSLTKWDERHFSGGETMLLQPNVLATDETYLLEPRFNQLAAWDARVPFGVRQVEGTEDPLDARVVLHGWFSKPAPFCTGSLSQEEAAPSLQAAMDAVHAALANLAPADGTVTLRLQVAGDGRPTGMQWLCNTLIAEPAHRGEQPWMVVDRTLSAIAETCMSMRFPASADGGSSEVTLPFCMLTGHVQAE